MIISDPASARTASSRNKPCVSEIMPICIVTSQNIMERHPPGGFCKQQMFIRVHPSDNVGIIVDPEGFTARERIPQSHKMALRAIEAGEPVIRYGQTIGLANRRIEEGAWVREELVDLPAPPSLDDLARATEIPAPMQPLEGFTFEGY